MSREQFIELCSHGGLGDPIVIATNNGIEEAEWHVGRFNATATFLEAQMVYLHVTDLKRRTYRDGRVGCDEDGANRLVSMVPKTEGA